MQPRRRRPSSASGPSRGHGNVFQTSDVSDAVPPQSSQPLTLPTNSSLTGHLYSPIEPPHRSLREDQLMQLRETHQGGHQQLDQKLADKQQARASFVLDERNSAMLSNSYTDFLSSLRNSSVGCEWIFGWALSQYATHDEASRLDLGLSRGFRFVHMCARRGCLSLEEKTPLQTASTLLLPVESRESVVIGYFMESVSDSETAAVLRTGKYVFFPSSRELLKVSKVRGPPNAAELASVCINRTSVVGHGVFVQEHAMVSFSWQDDATSVPEQYVVHSRTLSLCKMVESAERLGLQGESVTLMGQTTGGMNFLENSFYGLGPFGVFASTIVPSRLGFGAQAKGNESVRFSTGNWAVPQHALKCNDIQILHLGIEAKEIASLRSHFVAAYGHVSAQLLRQAPCDVSNDLPENQAVPSEGVMYRQQRPQMAQNLNQSSVRSMELLTFSTEGNVYGQKGTVPRDETGKESKATGGARNVPSPVPFTMGVQRLDANMAVNEGMRRREATKQGAGVTSSLSAFAATPLILPIQRQLKVAGAQTFSSSVGEGMKAAPSNVVDSIEAVVAAQQLSSSSGGMRAPSPSVAYSPPGVSFPAGLSTGGTRGGEMKQQENSSMSPPAFKKTLPAPTKNEIVIRNRISAQRSNEKRRRKIEATKNELAFLRTTYLPQLEHRRGSLLSENHNLRLNFMEKYLQHDIESFY